MKFKLIIYVFELNNVKIILSFKELVYIIIQINNFLNKMY